MDGSNISIIGIIGENMPQTYTVTTTDLEEKALRWVELDPQIWLETLVKHRAACAMKELYSIELKKALTDPSISSISSNIEEVVLASQELTSLEKHNKQQKEMTLDPANMAQLTTPAVVADTPRAFLGGGL